MELKKHKYLVPDKTFLIIRVRCTDGADDHVPGCILLDLHHVAGALKHRRLIHILHDDLDGGLIPERAHGEEARVDVSVLHLNAEAVLTFPLEVQRLPSRTERSCWTHCNFTVSSCHVSLLYFNHSLCPLIFTFKHPFVCSSTISCLFSGKLISAHGVLPH